jgi:hypothetical protein
MMMQSKVECSSSLGIKGTTMPTSFLLDIHLMKKVRTPACIRSSGRNRCEQSFVHLLDHYIDESIRNMVAIAMAFRGSWSSGTFN